MQGVTMTDYWSEVSRRRVGRRRLVVAAVGTSAAAAVLTACGSGGKSSGGSEKGDKTSLITKPADTSKQASRGGVVKFYATGDAPSLDPYTSNINLNQFEQPVYS